jgi:hypothetical protein
MPVRPPGSGRVGWPKSPPAEGRDGCPGFGGIVAVLPQNLNQSASRYRGPSSEGESHPTDHAKDVRG